MIGCALTIYNISKDAAITKACYLCGFFDYVAIFDNSDHPIDFVELSINNLIILGGKGNAGIGASQNECFYSLKANGCRYAVELDQDTFVDNDFLCTMADQFVEIEKFDSKIIALSPTISDTSGKSYRHNKSKNFLHQIDYSLSSGLFVSLDKYDSVGKKNEGFFIDLIDWEWCFRARSLGYTIYRTPLTTITHTLGEGRTDILGLSVGVPKPFRHYYQSRNGILLLFCDYVPGKFKAKLMFGILFKLIFYPLFMDSGFCRIRYMIRGIYDGFKNRLGSMRDR